MSVEVLVLTGYGINCDEETMFAFREAGAEAEIVHVNDINSLKKYDIFFLPGGFSFGDDTGSGKALANYIKHSDLYDELKNFVDDGKLVGGFCNGFQVLTLLGMLPNLKGDYTPEVALVNNDFPRYIDRWVDLNFNKNNKSPWITDAGTRCMPVAHGEGKFVAEPHIIGKLKKKKLIAARYVDGEICKYQELDPNPNGSMEGIAGITDETGQVFGMMPHPERAIKYTHRPDQAKIYQACLRAGTATPEEGPGAIIFRNAVNYVKGRI